MNIYNALAMVYQPDIWFLQVLKIAITVVHVVGMLELGKLRGLGSYSKTDI